MVCEIDIIFVYKICGYDSVRTTLFMRVSKDSGRCHVNAKITSSHYGCQTFIADGIEEQDLCFQKTSGHFSVLNSIPFK